MFTDRVRIKLNAGKGGNGIIAWRREKFIPKGGPYGGNGGPGGSIILKSDESLYSLEAYRNRSQIFAENGSQGGTNCRQGKQGQNLILTVPCGTLVKDPETGAILHDFTKPGEEYRICEGGKGGLGNDFFKSPTNRAPNKATPGKPGETKAIELELKLIADIGFVGLPNAGKSSLLSRLSKVDVKIAAYPFTTLTPNLSLIEFNDYSRITIADIPGIIEDAHKNKGLGLEFLRHIERSKTLLYLIDISDQEDPVATFFTLQSELKAYSPELASKPSLIALNKSDLCPDCESILERFQKAVPSDHIHLISAVTGTGLGNLVRKMKSLVQNG